MATVTLYNHSAVRFANGSNSASDSYRLMLCESAVFNGADTTLAAITKTEVASGAGGVYVTNGQLLTGVVISQSGNDAFFDADNVTWNVTSGNTLTAAKGILFNDTDSGDPPVAFLDFGGSVAVEGANPFSVIWATAGIVTWTVA